MTDIAIERPDGTVRTHKIGKNERRLLRIATVAQRMADYRTMSPTGTGKVKLGEVNLAEVIIDALDRFDRENA